MFNSFLPLIFVVLMALLIIYAATRKVWCPNCKKPSCRKVEPKVIEGWQKLRCKFCGFTKKIHVVDASNTSINSPH